MIKKWFENFFQEKNFIYIIILLSILPVIPFFLSQDLLHTHDGLAHLPRLAAFYKALSEGDFPVRFAGYLNYGYGLPLFNFIYQFPYFVGSLFVFVGFGLVDAFRISLSLSFVLSGIFSFLFAKLFFKDGNKALIFAVLYQFAPFRMVELLVRGSYGEVYAYVFLPAVLFGIELIRNKKYLLGTLFTAISTFLLIISHNSVSLLFFGAAGLFILLTYKKIKSMMLPFIGMFWGLVMSSYYWIPAILEHKYTYGNLYMEKLYISHFVPFYKLVIPNFTNDPRLMVEGISVYLGFFQVTGLFATVFVLLKYKPKFNEKRGYFYGIILLVLSLFMMLPVSKFIWGFEASSFLRQFQFPWRFLALSVLALSFLGVSLVFLFKNSRRKVLIIIFLSVLSVAFYWKAMEGYKRIDTKHYWNFPLNTTYYGETDVIWSAGPATSYPKNRVEFISSGGEISDFVRKNSEIKFDVFAESKADLVAHIQYFPGWNAYVNDKKVPIQFQDPNHRGEIVFSIPEGNSNVIIKFEENKLRLIADVMTIFGFLLIPFIFLIRKTK